MPDLCAYFCATRSCIKQTTTNGSQTHLPSLENSSFQTSENSDRACGR